MIPCSANPPASHIITGGPGSGKSTLIDALALEGFRHMPAAGRAVIHDQVAIGGTALPWSDRAAFAGLMLARELRSWHEAHARVGAVIFDRGVPDVSGYLRVSGLSDPAHLSEAARLSATSVACSSRRPGARSLGADAERKQDFAEAEATYEAMVAICTDLRYELMMLPLAPVTERACFVRSAIAGNLD